MNRWRKVAGVRLFDIVVRPVAWLYRVLTLRNIIGAALVAAGLFGIYKADAWLWTAGRPIIRDLAMTYIADKLAGPQKPLKMCDALFAGGREDCDLVYSRSVPFNPSTQWGLVTNSSYLTEMATRILPSFTTEGIVSAADLDAPNVIYFLPLFGPSSYHLGGSTNCSTSVRLNERYITFAAWNDEKELYATMTHELIHNQDGNFCGSPEPLPPTCEWIDILGDRMIICSTVEGTELLDGWIERRSEWVEQHTSAATVEALAAMCRRTGGNGPECNAFWNEIAGLTRGSLYTELRVSGLGWAYEPLMNVLVRTRAETVMAEKSYLDYSSQGPVGLKERDTLIAKYQAGPWQKYVLAGVVDGIPLDTGNAGYVFSGDDKAFRVILGMPYDDTRKMLGPLGVFLWALTP